MRVSRLEQVAASAGIFVFSGAALQLLRAETGFVYQAQEGDRVIQGVFAAFYIFAFAVLLLEGSKSSRATRSILPILRLYTPARADRLTRLAPAFLWAPLAFAGLSTFWSADPSITLRRLIGLVGATVFGVYLGRRFALRSLMRNLVISLGAVSLLSYATVVFLPDLGIMSGENEGAWSGIFTHKNPLGRMAGLTLITLALLLWRHRLALLATCIPVAYLVLHTQSVTTLVALCTVAALFTVRWASTQGSTAAFATGTGVAAVLATVLVIGPLNVFARSSTLTGRTRIWGGLPDALTDRVVIGHGYQAFWDATEYAQSTIPSKIGWFPEHAHNGYLDFILEVGVVGGALWIATLIVLLLLTRGTGLLELYGQAFVIYVLILNLAESTMTRPNSLFWILVAALFTTAIRHRVEGDPAGQAVRPQAAVGAPSAE